MGPPEDSASRKMSMCHFKGASYLPNPGEFWPKQQKKQRDKLASAQSNRKRTLAKIKKNISNDQVYLSELQRNETRLKAEIAKAVKRNRIPMDGLARQKGRLPWPLKGKVLHNYGSRQTGQINWKGMVISANYGDAVKAVYSGTVVFSDYLLHLTTFLQ